MYFLVDAGYNLTMPSTFVTVDRNEFIKALVDAGFTPDLEARGELVYQFQHRKDQTMFVKVYTSMPLNGGDTRPLGADAIRVVLIFKNAQTGKSGCLFKAPKVLRTGSSRAVIERTLERARAAYAEGNKRLKK